VKQFKKIKIIVSRETMTYQYLIKSSKIDNRVN